MNIGNVVCCTCVYEDCAVRRQECTGVDVLYDDPCCSRVRTGSEVPTLRHESRDDTMERRVEIMQILAKTAATLFAST